MFTWFSNIFADVSDQARLATVLISAAVAIIVVFINQALNNKRENKSFRAEKIELLYASNHGFIKTVDKIKKFESLKELEENSKNNLLTLLNEAEESHNTSHMLITLYFPKLLKKTVQRSMFLNKDGSSTRIQFENLLMGVGYNISVTRSYINEFKYDDTYFSRLKDEGGHLSTAIYRFCVNQ